MTVPIQRVANFLSMGVLTRYSTPQPASANRILIDYGASKAAMVAIVKALLRKHGGDYVLVKSVLPGLVHTPVWERAAIEIGQGCQV